MANNQSRATLTPPSVRLTAEQEATILASYGSFEPGHHGAKGRSYCYWDGSWQSPDSDHEEFVESWWSYMGEPDESVVEAYRQKTEAWDMQDVFRDILLNEENKELDHLRFEGANTCSKMRPGEFGGFVLVVTRTHYHWSSTHAVTVKGGDIVVTNTTPTAFEE